MLCAETIRLVCSKASINCQASPPPDPCFNEGIQQHRSGVSFNQLTVDTLTHSSAPQCKAMPLYDSRVCCTAIVDYEDRHRGPPEAKKSDNIQL